MNADTAQYELRERMIADLPALMAQFEAQNGPIETQPLIPGRQLSVHVLRQYSCPEKRAVVGPSVVLPSPKRKRGRAPGPLPRNLELMRELVPLDLPLTELIKRSGLSRPTVLALRKRVREEIEAKTGEARSRALDLIQSTLGFRREFRMRHFRARGYDRWTKVGLAQQHVAPRAQGERM